MNEQQKTERKPTQWIDDLLAEINLMQPDLFAPRHDIDEDEKRVGEVPEELRKFFAFFKFLEREMAQLKVDAQYSMGKDELPGAQRRMVMLKNRYQAAQWLFWACVMDYFDAWEPSRSLWVRTGWMITESEATSGPFDIMRSIFGGS